MLFWAPAVHGGGALLIFSFILDIDTPYWMIGLTMGFLGMGGAMHMPATTDTSMAAVPVDLAGKASAVNNAGRQLGGTLAIAILGSFAAAVYSSGVTAGLEPLDIAEGAVETISTGMGAALQVLPTLDQAIIPQAQLVMRESFVDAIVDTMRFGIIFALISGIVAWILVPKRQRQTQMQWEGGKPVEPSAQPSGPAQPAAALSSNGVSGNGTSANGARGLSPLARSMVVQRPQKSSPP